jgi:hypothetical protein
MEAHIIANKGKIQADHFNSQEHVHSVLGQKTYSAVLLVEFLPQGSTINAGVYCDTKLHCAIQNNDMACLVGVL